VERVGLGYVKERVVEDADGRREAAERFYYAQRFSQADPWAERAQGVDAHEYTPLKLVG